MRINITQIMKTTRCNEEHALDIERYIDNSDMLNWSEASKMLINTIVRAVHDKLLRGAPAIVEVPRAPKTVKTKSTKKPVNKVAKVPASSSKISQMLSIYKRYEGCTRQEMITYIVSEMTSLHGVELTRHKAAGYYQTCKKKAA